MKRIASAHQLELTIDRLCFELLERHGDFQQSAIIGLQPRGVMLSDRIYHRLLHIQPRLNLRYGKLDITFYRDDFKQRSASLVPNTTDIDFVVEGLRVILIDDVLYTGRTIRSALDAMLDFGRPATVELLVLIDRKFSRQLPIQADYVGKRIDSIVSQKVKVCWKEVHGRDEVLLLDENET
ncbi:bifunctional pyr operon transcriptional regulator/uracil phosphoribosyltransferase PyrR [Thermoflavifilum thermophilum]|uniref:Pyrimidine operon attenuation protein / uracil phosphoribosyltransferase n=1 Tax=Thermoflavifilum thermophilum TaxID=1393122 RepID=A0A1I7N1Q3_9BACT|nr:bifunctional pyr operon transcriptional regulator/uracil phosphoribosyltransferase PyrR [Thermoflavifilum thermophilum]SFV28568.1 pyrimidine operon attenuation protein / uracil phosphoribosyltransferase [Thermoflavifilum thermophilum]